MDPPFEHSDAKDPTNDMSLPDMHAETKEAEERSVTDIKEGATKVGYATGDATGEAKSTMQKAADADDVSMHRVPAATTANATAAAPAPAPAAAAARAPVLGLPPVDFAAEIELVVKAPRTCPMCKAAVVPAAPAPGDDPGLWPCPRGCGQWWEVGYLCPTYKVSSVALTPV
ncbi:hypothetical protein FOA52_003237 [Chlamydomonas sp. UWO 241]|nr:hypothetical protein FOA52_003237 [Chlamydomonas sp. UWO 241]